MRTRDDETLDPEQLIDSGLVVAIRNWLDKLKSTIAVDNVEETTATLHGVTIRLRAFARSTRAAALALPLCVLEDPDSDPDDAEAPRLASIDLSLAFRTGGATRPRKKPRCTQPRNDSVYDYTDSQLSSQAVPGITLASQLLSPAALHFTLATVLEAVLTRLVKKLVVAYPLCFNARWIDRITNDLPTQHSVSTSLCNILGLSGGRTPEADEVETKAVQLSRRLEQHLATTYPTLFPPPAASPSNSANSPGPPIDPALLPSRSPSLSPPEPAANVQPALETALLLLATRGTAPDAWTAPRAAEDGARAAGGAKGKEKTGQARGKRGLSGGVVPKKVRGRKKADAEERLLDDDDVDAGRRSASASLDYDVSDSHCTLAFSDGDADEPLSFDDEDEGGDGDEMDWLAD